MDKNQREYYLREEMKAITEELGELEGDDSSGLHGKIKDSLMPEELKEKLMAYCKENVEGYGCPRKIEVMDALPRTKMEKIDFVALSDKVPTA